MKKLIFIFERRHYYEYDGRMFYLDYFESKGYEVEVWSAVHWTFGRDISMPINIQKEKKLIYIDNIQDFKREVARISNEKCEFIVYPYHAYTKVSYLIRKKIKQSGFRFSNLTEAPDLCEMKQDYYMNCGKAILYYFQRIINKYIKVYKQEEKKKESSIKRIKKSGGYEPSFIYSFFGPILWKSFRNLVITKSQLSTLPNKFETLSKRNIIFPHNNYRKYLEIKDQKQEKNYVVFIDEYECGHSDWEKLGYPYPILNKKLYYFELNRFFSYIEVSFSTEVIIAAHPKAEYSGKEFDGRRICRMHTEELVRDAKLVLYMYGTCITYIVLFNKPFIIFGTSQHFQGHIVDHYMYDTAKFFGAEILKWAEIDKKYDLQKYISHNQKKYEILLDMMGIPKEKQSKEFESAFLYIEKLLLE